MDHLNESCFCLGIDEAALQQALEVELGSPGLYQLTRERCPYLFSTLPLFVGKKQRLRMREVIEAIEKVVALPTWQRRILSNAPEIVSHDPKGTGGVLLGYDFHLNAQSLGLIEINTNAGGAMLNAVLARAQRACCEEVAGWLPDPIAIRTFEHALVAMFRREWQLMGQSRSLTAIAIVDDNPEQQYLYPEFLLFQQLFRRHGLSAEIVAPERLERRGNILMANGKPVDLVYNRLTDFLLEQPAHAVLRQAYLDEVVVLTPNPRAHALYADKRNVALLTSRDSLDELDVPETIAEILMANIPRTEVVTPVNAEQLWAVRRQLFFKPVAGYGSKGAFRGDKITRRVWEDVKTGGFVAQALIAPGERRTGESDQQARLKFDLRNYVYNGSTQWLAARLYQGQTTNFRTPGGGFAPVYGKLSVV